jgi:hypothetical protein
VPVMAEFGQRDRICSRERLDPEQRVEDALSLRDAGRLWPTSASFDSASARFAVPIGRGGERIGDLAGTRLIAQMGEQRRRVEHAAHPTTFLDQPEPVTSERGGAGWSGARGLG